MIEISDPAMNSNQRITLLKKKIQDLRKTYNMIKTELASIDRRRKKLRRREREMKKNGNNFDYKLFYYYMFSSTVRTQLTALNSIRYIYIMILLIL